MDTSGPLWMPRFNDLYVGGGFLFGRARANPVHRRARRVDILQELRRASSSASSTLDRTQHADGASAVLQFPMPNIQQLGCYNDFQPGPSSG
jgi:hypothetical protein